MKKTKNKNRFYYNPNFLGSPEGRSIRILSEYYGPKQRFNKNQIEDTIVFFGSARILSKKNVENSINSKEKTQKRDQMNLIMSRYYEDARILAKKITKWSMNITEKDKKYIICSGGGPGIMEAANRGAKEAGGKSIGLTISLPYESSNNPYITKDLNLKFHYFFMRKFWFLYSAKAFIVWPGGFGTLDELMELLTLIQTRKIKKKLPIILYGKEFWEKIINWNYLVDIGTISKEDLKLFHISNDIEDAYSYLIRFLKKQQLKGPNF